MFVLFLLPLLVGVAGIARKCSICHQTGHNRGTCPQNRPDELYDWGGDDQCVDILRRRIMQRSERRNDQKRGTAPQKNAARKDQKNATQLRQQLLQEKGFHAKVSEVSSRCAFVAGANSPRASGGSDCCAAHRMACDQQIENDPRLRMLHRMGPFIMI